MDKQKSLHRRRSRTKAVINLLKRGQITSEELKKETKIPKTSLHRILNELKAIELVNPPSEKGGYWSWSEYNKPYNTIYAREQALKHSWELLPSFAALLEPNPQPLLDYRQNKIVPKGPRYSIGYSIVIEARIHRYFMSIFLEEHLQTGYPDIYKSLENFRKLWVKLEKLRQSKIGETMENLQSKMLELNKFVETQKLMTKAFGELSDKLLLVKIKVESGEPLAGHCRACPNMNAL